MQGRTINLIIATYQKLINSFNYIVGVFFVAGTTLMATLPARSNYGLIIIQGFKKKKKKLY
jgi:hypothetical protein